MIHVVTLQTFDVPDGGDFASYLANASELTITNIQEEGSSSSAPAPIQIQLTQVNYFLLPEFTWRLGLLGKQNAFISPL